MNLLKRTKQEVCTCNVKDMEKTIEKFTDEQEMLDAYINGEYTAKEIVSVFLPDDVKEQYNIYCSEKICKIQKKPQQLFLVGGMKKIVIENLLPKNCWTMKKCQRKLFRMAIKMYSLNGIRILLKLQNSQPLRVQET